MFDIDVVMVMGITDIDDKIKILQRMKKALFELSKACSGAGPITECPILEALEK